MENCFFKMKEWLKIDEAVIKRRLNENLMHENWAKMKHESGEKLLMCSFDGRKYLMKGLNEIFETRKSWSAGLVTLTQVPVRSGEDLVFYDEKLGTGVEKI